MSKIEKRFIKFSLKKIHKIYQLIPRAIVYASALEYLNSYLPKLKEAFVKKGLYTEEAVHFQSFLIKNVSFLIKNVSFLIKNVSFLIENVSLLVRIYADQE